MQSLFTGKVDPFFTHIRAIMSLKVIFFSYQNYYFANDKLTIPQNYTLGTIYIGDMTGKSKTTNCSLKIGNNVL